MKSNTEKIALAIAILIIILVIAGIVGLVSLVKRVFHITKEAISVNTFIEVMEDNDFAVTKVTDKDSTNAKDAYIAEKGEYQIEFYTFDDVDDADDFFNITRSKFDSDRANTRIQFHGRNYESFNIVTGGKYKFVERIDKTVIYVNVDNEYKKSVNDALEKLGY